MQRQVAKPAPQPVPGPLPSLAAEAPIVPGSVEKAQIMDWLGQVPDPEIPVVSITDLGIVRDVNWVDEVLEVKVTPTYSGCPATRVIEVMIVDALKARGVASVQVTPQISPAWTTDWITQDAKAALEKYGIAPPRAAGGPNSCPHCGSGNVEMVSNFGSTPCKAQWRCRSCLEPFDYFKCI